MNHPRAELANHGGGKTLPFSAQPSHGISGGGRPPRPTAVLPAKTRRRAFVAPSARPTAPPPGGVLPPRQDATSPGGGLPLRQEAPSTGDGLPRRLPKALVPGGLPPRGPHASSFTALHESPSRYHESRQPFSDAATWDARGTTSSTAVGYEAVGDDFSPTPTPVFDWTPDYSANLSVQDPMTYSSQPFMNLMTQDADADLELLMQPTPSSAGKGASKRGNNYSHDEDIQLCISWMNISNDPIVGNEQPAKTYWERIAEDFHKNKNFESDRTPNYLEHRCGVILKDCMKFQGYYEEVERRHPSGVPYQEHLMEAQARYARTAKGRNCQLIHCWLKLRHSPKFTSLDGNKRPAKSREVSQDGEGRQEASQDQDGSSIPPAKKQRPPGRKQSKEKLKRNEGEDEYKEMMQNLIVMKTEEHMMKKERWNKDMMLEQRRLEIEERRLQWEQEQKIMFCDVTNMDEHQRVYVLAKRAEIAKMASLSSSGGASVGESGAEFSSV